MIDPAKFFYQESHYSIGLERLSAAFSFSSPLSGVPSRLTSFLVGLFELLPVLGSVVVRWDQSRQIKIFTHLDEVTRKKYIDEKTSVSQTSVKIQNLFFQKSLFPFSNFVKNLSLQKTTDLQGKIILRLVDQNQDESVRFRFEYTFIYREDLQNYIKELEADLNAPNTKIVDWLKKEIAHLPFREAKPNGQTHSKRKSPKKLKSSTVKNPSTMTNLFSEARHGLQKAKTLRELTSTFRQKSLLLHPDKRRDLLNQEATREYTEFQKVYEKIKKELP